MVIYRTLHPVSLTDTFFSSPQEELKKLNGACYLYNGKMCAPGNQIEWFHLAPDSELWDPVRLRGLWFHYAKETQEGK